MSKSDVTIGRSTKERYEQLQRLSALASWTLAPDTREGVLPRLLEALEDSDLFLGFTVLQGAVARLCWVEYGRRRGFVEFDIKVATLGDGTIQVTASGEGKPIHDHPLFDLPFKDKE